MEHYEVRIEVCCQMSNCFVVGDMNIDQHKTSAIGILYSNYLKRNGCYRGIKEATRVTSTSESFFDHIVHNECRNVFEFGVIEINTTLRINKQLMSK